MGFHDNSLHEYTWLIVMGSFSAFGFGWGTGANDVANAFGTSIGAKTLTLGQATIIAAIFEFAGALILGRVSTNVIAGGISDVEVFAREPEVYAYGMCCALFVGTFFLYLASYIGLNVSSTHSIIGGIIGFSLVYGGRRGVNWYQKDTTVFPPAKGIVPIIVSWFFTPAITAGFAAIMFFILRTFILRRENAYIYSLYLLPVFVFLTLWVCFFFVFTKGAAKMFSETDTSWTDHKNRKSGWVAACISGGASVISACFIPFLKKRILRMDEEARNPVPVVVVDNAEKEGYEAAEEAAADEAARNGSMVDRSNHQVKKLFRQLSKAALHGINVDIHDVVEDDPIIAAIHARAEVFDPRAEHAFKYLQVFSAICVIFSHGAGDVGYMTGPLCAIWFAVQDGVIRKAFVPPIWIIIIGASGLVVGLATYGYNVTRAMGVKLSKLSASRGFCAELATAMVLLVASQLGLPTSSSQCVTGGIIGVGLVEGANGVNWKQLSLQVGSWASTLFIMGLGTACLFCQGVYAPSMPIGQRIITYEAGLSSMSVATLNNVNATLYSLKTASIAGVLPNLPYNLSATGAPATLSYVDYVTLDKRLKALKKSIDTIDPFKATAKANNGTAAPQNYFALQSQIANLVSELSIMKIGAVDTTGHVVANFENALDFCASPAAPFPATACPPVKLGVPIYYDKRQVKTFNFSSRLGDTDWIN